MIERLESQALPNSSLPTNICYHSDTRLFQYVLIKVRDWFGNSEKWKLLPILREQWRGVPFKAPFSTILSHPRALSKSFRIRNHSYKPNSREQDSGEAAEEDNEAGPTMVAHSSWFSSLGSCQKEDGNQHLYFNLKNFHRYYPYYVPPFYLFLTLILTRQEVRILRKWVLIG